MSEQFDINKYKAEYISKIIDLKHINYKELIAYLTNTKHDTSIFDTLPKFDGLNLNYSTNLFNFNSNIQHYNPLTKIVIYIIGKSNIKGNEVYNTGSIPDIYKCKLYCDKIGYKMLIFLLEDQYLNNSNMINARILLNIDFSDVYYMNDGIIREFKNLLQKDVYNYYITNERNNDLVNFLSSFNKFTNIPNILSKHMVVFDKFRIYFKYGIEETSLKVLIKEYANSINPDEDLKITIKEIWDYIQLLVNNIPDFKKTISYIKHYGKVSQYNESDKKYISKTLHSSFEPMVMDKVDSLKDDKTITYYKITNLEYKEVNKEVEPFYSSVEKSIPVYTSKLKHYICLMFDNVIKDDKYYKE